MRVDVQCHALATLRPRKGPGTHCTGGWVGSRAGLDRCGKSCLHREIALGSKKNLFYSVILKRYET
jgi:hypothetical protein